MEEQMVNLHLETMITTKVLELLLMLHIKVGETDTLLRIKIIYTIRILKMEGIIDKSLIIEIQLIILSEKKFIKLMLLWRIQLDLIFSIQCQWDHTNGQLMLTDKGNSIIGLKEKKIINPIRNERDTGEINFLFKTTTTIF